MKPFEKGDVVIIYDFYVDGHCYYPMLIQNAYIESDFVGNSIIQTTSEFGLTDHFLSVDKIKVNCGPMTFEEFYNTVDVYHPEYAVNIISSKEKILKIRAEIL